MAIATFVFYSQTSELGYHYVYEGATAWMPYYDSIGHYIGGFLAASLLFLWVTVDSAKLCARMQPDEYMKGVVYFYTDFLLVCCCCLFASCMGSAAS